MEFLGTLEAEKLTKEKWKQYCGTPCMFQNWLYYYHLEKLICTCSLFTLHIVQHHKSGGNKNRHSFINPQRTIFAAQICWCLVTFIIQHHHRDNTLQHNMISSTFKEQNCLVQKLLTKLLAAYTKGYLKNVLYFLKILFTTQNTS